jgi:hypothetical protein
LRKYEGRVPKSKCRRSPSKVARNSFCTEISANSPVRSDLSARQAYAWTR